MNRKYTLLLCGCLLFNPLLTRAQDICINEVMASNASVYPDEDGEYSDWIELYNRGDHPVVLTGYGLSDDRDDLDKWIFPDLSLSPSHHIIIFASDKNRRTPRFWDTAIDQGANWRYHPGGPNIPSNWRSLNFDDSSWPEAPSGFGYGDDDDSTVLDPGIFLFIRKRFQVTQPELISGAALHIDYDDGFVAYLNGQEIARSNLGTAGTSVPYTQTADSPHEAMMYQGGDPEAFELTLNNLPLVEGENVLAIQVHNVSETSSDLTVIPFFSLQYASVPDHPIHVSEVLSLPAGGLHTNFKISAGGESLYLTDQISTLVDSFPADSLPTDISKGRAPDGSDSWQFFIHPTPGWENDTSGYPDISGNPQFSVPGGFYSAEVTVSLSSDSPQGVLKYTLDGAPPDMNSSTYINPLGIDSNTVVRARLYEPGQLPGRIVTHTYFIGEHSDLPVISLAMQPADLWDSQTGIYVLGDNYESELPYFGANFWQDWERPAHVEFFEPDRNHGWSSDVGVKIFGSYSRALPQKSLSIFFRGEYGRSSLDYPLFPESSVHDFSAFILRNSGNDWSYSLMRDATLQELVRPLDLDIQAYRPCVLYINGEYWGIHNIREKINEEYLASHHGVNPDSVDILEGNATVVEGDANHYNAMMDYINSHSMALTTNFTEVESMMNIDNFMDYEIAEIYYDNEDWPGNNVKFWRPHTRNGKWRWLLYDTDFGFGIYDANAYQNNTLEFALATNGPGWPNPPWATLLLRKLLQNQGFKIRFINRFADHLNTVFYPDTVIATITRNQSAIAAEMDRHFHRWAQPIWWCQTNLGWTSLNPWYTDLQNMRTFALNRPAYVRGHLMQRFGLPGTIRIHADISDPAGGDIQINSVIPSHYPWQGIYFQSVPVKIRALPRPGYRFVSWDGHPEWDNSEITLNSDSDVIVQPQFAVDSTETSGVVINEVNYNSNDAHDSEDWIEFYNPGTADRDISQWYFSDEEDAHQFVFPENTVVEAGGYLILCMDTTLFRNWFPEAGPILGNADFGLSGGGELIRLFDGSGVLMDSLIYDDDDPWPTAADGDGPTLELVNPVLDNALPDNWGSSSDYGTPGARNSVYRSVGVANESSVPASFKLLQNYPNPFNPSTTICYQTNKSAYIHLNIYDVQGHLVRTLASGIQSAGSYSHLWDGKTNDGHAVSGGLYFYRLTASDDQSGLREFSQTGKMVLLK